jgi:hypothetical protein
MAKLDGNLVMLDTRGKFGGQIVFKRRAGKMYVSAPPQIDADRVPTPGQQVARNKFKRCIAYAKAAAQDTALRAGYLARAGYGQTAYNIALKDAYNAPEVMSMITLGYRGRAGDILVIQAKDDFKVVAVKVQVYGSSGEMIEEGTAFENGDGLNWVYVAKEMNANVPGSKIIATAFDLPGNEGCLEAFV